MSISSRAKFQADAPANFGDPSIASDEQPEKNPRKHYHRKGKTPTGRSGRNFYKPDYARGGKRH